MQVLVTAANGGALEELHLFALQPFEQLWWQQNGQFPKGFQETFNDFRWKLQSRHMAMADMQTILTIDNIIGVCGCF